MADRAAQLNELLTIEWACVRALRRAEAVCDDPGQKEVVKRVRKDSSFNSVALANLVRTQGGRPADVPSARFTIQVTGETFAEAVDMAQSAQDHLIAEIEKLLDESDLKPIRSHLVQIRQLHVDNVRWLKTALGN